MAGKTEKELRYVLTAAQYEGFKKQIETLDHYTPGHAVKELTVMYDNPNPQLTFYSKEVDGRLRVRTSKPGIKDAVKDASTDPSVSMLTWKQRIPEHIGKELNQEREIEVEIEPKEMDSMLAILEKVLHCPRISSYERNRETLYVRGVEVASDTFPYGHVIELELKEAEDENVLYEVAEILGLKECKTSSLSCDDMYRRLCANAGVEARSDILFHDEEMPDMGMQLEKGVLEL